MNALFNSMHVGIRHPEPALLKARFGASRKLSLGINHVMFGYKNWKHI